MKTIYFLLALISISGVAQKQDMLYLNKLQTVPSSDFVVTHSSRFYKMASDEERNKIVAVNSKTGTSRVVAFPTGLQINEVKSDFLSEYKKSRFILVQCGKKEEKSASKAQGYSRELYLLSLETFDHFKLNAANYNCTDVAVNDFNSTLTMIETENVRESGTVKVVTIDLKTGNRTEAFSGK